MAHRKGTVPLLLSVYTLWSLEGKHSRLVSLWFVCIDMHVHITNLCFAMNTHSHVAIKAGSAAEYHSYPVVWKLYTKELEAFRGDICSEAIKPEPGLRS